MDTLHYRYLDARGEAATAQAVVASRADLERRLAEQGCLLLAVRRERARALMHRYVQWRAQPQLTWWLLQLVQMLEAGLPLLDALRVLQQGASGRWLRRIAGELAEEVASGVQFSEALCRYPSLFPPMLQALVAIGECSGRLSATLEQARATLQWQQRLRRRLTAALVYPLLSMLTLGGAVFFLLWKVVPSLQSFLQSTATTPSVTTEWLVVASDWLHRADEHRLPTAFACVVAAVIALIAWRAWPGAPVLQRWLRVRSHAPRSHLQQAALLRSTATLYEAGIDLVEALRLSRSQLTGAGARQGIERVAVAVSSGVSLHTALHESRLLPHWVCCLLSSSRQRSSVLRGLRQAADGLQRDAQWRLERRDILLPNLLLALLGLIMLVVVSGLVVPLMTLGLDTGVMR